VKTEEQYNHLSFSDVATDNPSDHTVILLNIKLSKTGQGRVGCQVILGKTNDELCPVMALLQYLARHGGLPGAMQDGTPLSKAKFVEARFVCSQPTSADHSFRIGAATTAAVIGLQDSAIATDVGSVEE